VSGEAATCSDTEVKAAASVGPVSIDETRRFASQRPLIPVSCSDATSTAHPAVTDFRYRLALCRSGLGWLLAASGRAAEAEAEFRAALALQQGLANDHPEVPAYHDQAANARNNLAVVLRRLGRPAEAIGLAERAVAARSALVGEDPETTSYRAGLAESHLNRGLARRALGDPVGAAADVRRSVALWQTLPSPTGEQSFLSACAAAALAGLRGQPGSGLSAAEAARAADTAMGLLHRAVRLGYRSPDAYRTEDALDVLRGRDDFKLLMLDLALPADPFAAAR
jgi:tetratricopeptide (TPR) repeat protein